MESLVPIEANKMYILQDFILGENYAFPPTDSNIVVKDRKLYFVLYFQKEHPQPKKENRKEYIKKVKKFIQGKDLEEEYREIYNVLE